MAAIPHLWDAYARSQHKLSSTRCIAFSAALEQALNVVHQPGFRPEDATDLSLHRTAANAARQGRHRAALRRKEQATALGSNMGAISEADDCDGISPVGPRSLDEALHARRELARLAAAVPESDWNLLTEVAVGVPYGALAMQCGSTSAALRSRVCRLRQTLQNMS